MKKFTKIMLILSGICIVLGLVLIVATGLIGDLYYAKGYMRLGEASASGSTIQVPTQNIQDLELSVKAAALEVVSEEDADEISIISDSDHLILEHSVDDDTLHVTVQLNKKYRQFGDAHGTLVIPADMTFDEVQMKLSASSLNVDGLGAAELDVELNASSADLHGVDAAVLEIDSNASSLFLNGEVGRELNVECNASDTVLELKGVYEDFSYEINGKIGDIRVGEHEYSGLKDEVFEKSEGSQKTAKLECKAGSIDVQFYE